MRETRTHAILAALAAAAAGALLAVCALLVACDMHPVVSFDLERDTPPAMTGVYPTERDGHHAFVWTSHEATMPVPGLDRHLAWSCVVRFRGARATPATPQPEVLAAVDGATLASARATNDYQEMTVAVPARPTGRGMVFGLTSTPIFTPGGGDARELGVQLDMLRCVPGQGVVTPPRGTLARAALAGAAIGAAIGAAGLALPLTALLVIVVALGQAMWLSAGLAPFTGYPTTVAWFACAIAAVSIVAQHVTEAVRRRPLSSGARAALAVTAITLFFNLLGLFHPLKNQEDVVFQAHRLDWVLSGRYFFTQTMPSGVVFPYAIGLFVFAAPWARLAHDHVALLRIVVCSVDAVAGLLLYPMIVRAWNDRLAGALAVLFFGLVPFWFSVIGNANLTNAFGQSVALMALAMIVIWRLGGAGAPEHPAAAGPAAEQPHMVLVQAMALTCVVTLAFLSHVSTVTLLAATLAVTAVLFAWHGGAPMRRVALVIAAVTAAAVAISFVLYYDHFMGAYKALGRVTASGTGDHSPISARALDAFKQLIDGIGGPIILLAIIGVWRILAEGTRDRLVWVIAAVAIVAATFTAQNLLTPVDPKFERYAAEFIGRIDFASYPMLAILAGRGAAWSWRSGGAWRVGAFAIGSAAIVIGARAWLGWLA